jgi:hypothetical protein
MTVETKTIEKGVYEVSFLAGYPLIVLAGTIEDAIEIAKAHLGNKYVTSARVLSSYVIAKAE